MRSQGDIVLVAFPFTDLARSKVRPALVVAAPRDLILIPLTSVLGHELSVRIAHPSLDRESEALYAKLFTVEEQLIRATIGSLPAADLRTVLKLVGGLFATH